MPDSRSAGKTGSGSRRGNPVLIVSAVVVVLFVFSLFTLSALADDRPSGKGAVEKAAPSVSPAGGAGAAPAGKPVERIALKVSDFDDGKARFYYREVSGKKLKFFVIRSSDGIIRAAFDACDVCFPAQKGYRQNGDLMVCNNCGQRFPSVKINEEKGGCNPSPLERTIEGEKIIITLDSLAEGLYLF